MMNPKHRVARDAAAQIRNETGYRAVVIIVDGSGTAGVGAIIGYAGLAPVQVEAIFVQVVEQLADGRHMFAAEEGVPS